MDVLVLPGYFGFGGWVEGGPGTTHTGVFFRDQAIALAKAGHTVVLPHVHFDATAGVHEECVFEDVAQFVFVHVAPWKRLNTVRRIWYLYKAARAAFPSGRPEIIHAHVFTALPQAWLLSRLFRVPYVVTEHSSTVRRGMMSRGWRFLSRLGYRRAAAVIAVSEPLAKAVQTVAAIPVQVVPNMVRDEFFADPLPARPPRKFRFVSVGYGEPKKGWDLLLEAFAKMLSGGFEAELYLVGDAPEHIRNLIDELGLQSSVSVWGRVEPGHVRAVLRRSDCHVMPSRVETFGIGTIEALASGLPVVMTETDAASVIVNDSNGLVVPVGDVAALASAMITMLGTPDRYDAEAIRAETYDRFSGQALASTLERVYETATRR